MLVSHASPNKMDNVNVMDQIWIQNHNQRDLVTVTCFPALVSGYNYTFLLLILNDCLFLLSVANM